MTKMNPVQKAWADCPEKTDPEFAFSHGFVAGASFEPAPRNDDMRRRPRDRVPPPHPDVSRLIGADGLRYYIANNPAYEYLSDQQFGEKLGLSAGFVGMVRSGTRPPSQAFLDAIGWEAVTLYRMKNTAAPAVSVLGDQGGTNGAS